MASGLIDALCYLGLGGVFTANMTGNIVVLGFAAAGAAGFSVPATLTSLLVFVGGAICASQAIARIPPGQRSLLLLTAMTTEVVFVGVAAVVAFSVPAVGHGWPRYMLIALLVFPMGVPNTAMRRFAVPDMTTTVLTMTVTAQDSGCRGDARRGGRRCRAVPAQPGWPAAGPGGGSGGCQLPGVLAQQGPRRVRCRLTSQR